MEGSEKGACETSFDVTVSRPCNASPSSLENREESSEDALSIKFLICYRFQISVFKPLFPLKLFQFFWIGASFALDPFVPLYCKQKGLTVSELSIIYMISTPIEFLTGTLSGVISDKIGRLKPVLVTNFLISIISLFSMLLLPNMNYTDCKYTLVQLRRNLLEFDELVAKASCGINRSSMLNVQLCQVNCPQHVTENCIGVNKTCAIHKWNEELRNFSLSLHITSSFVSKNHCLYNVDCVTNNNSTYSWCDEARNRNCTTSCNLLAGEKCSHENWYRIFIFVITLVLMVTYLTATSNGYHLVDVAIVSIAKEHNKSFGREQVWRAVGLVIFSTLIGYIVRETSFEGQRENYTALFYFYGIMVCVNTIFLWKLKVRNEPRSKQMWKKTAVLLRNPDIIVFLFLLLVLSTIRGFIKHFLSWHLEDLKASSVLIGLAMAAGYLYSIPFLMTSKWLVSKIGTNNIFLLSCCGNAAYCLGYSLLQNPWISLALEIITVLTIYLLFVALIEYSHSVAPKGLVSTVIASIEAFYYNIGKGTGSLIGGQIMSAYGGKVAFRAFAVASLVCAVIYFIYIQIRRLHKNEEQHIKEISVQGRV